MRLPGNAADAAALSSASGSVLPQDWFEAGFDLKSYDTRAL
jgi:hypothetical protein